MESLRPLNKANFADVLDYGIFLYKKHFKKIFLLNLMLNIPYLLLITGVTPMLTGSYQSLFDAQTMGTNLSGLFSSIFSLYAKLFIFLGIYAIYGLTLKNILEGCIVKIIYSDVVFGEDRSIKRVLKECLGQFGTMILGKILYNLIQGAVFFAIYIVIISGVFIISFAVMGVFSTSIVSPWITVVLTIIGVFAAIAVIFFISLIISFFTGKYWLFLPAICIEQKKAGASVERCNKVGGNNFYLIGFTYLFIYIIVYMLPGLINYIISFVNLASGSMDITAISIGSIITQLVSSILQPVIACTLTALYITLRVKREGLDMEIDLWEIKKEEAAKAKRWTAEAQV